MADRSQLQADGVTSPAKGKLWERDERDERKVPGALLKTKHTSQWKLPFTFRTGSQWSCADFYTNGLRLGDCCGWSRK